jgi:hypothetical protein
VSFALEAALGGPLDATVSAHRGWPTTVVVAVAIALLALGTALGWLLR